MAVRPGVPIPWPLSSRPGFPSQITFPLSAFPPTSGSNSESSGRLINCYAEPLGDPASPGRGEPAPQVWRKTPGLTQFNATATGQSGYRGRTGIYELILIDESLRRLIHDRAGEPALRDACARAGVRTLGQDGTRWLADGTTSLAELLRVAGAAA